MSILVIMARSRNPVLRHFYVNRTILRRIVNVLMRLSGLSLFFFLIGMEQRFTTETQYFLLDTARYTANLALSTALVMVVLRILSRGQYRGRSYRVRLLIDIIYLLFILVLVVSNSLLRVWLDGRSFI
ncbi:hypothetical protein PVA44_02885 [Entomospira nematocerorum]|uniref:Uncharacterized protein n=1 Tax=Entomospira nematocerorum TaxID=2719987 RepID=A0A968GEX4_9SPIO|nr:hypothetical protein [Entomospira nematocera]NIZ47020.1 hypothetical protein [Entomospira nematocera]WDI34435.1 hypothetical protein PVA44_02885 [Entomospira nematocera]